MKVFIVFLLFTMAFAQEVDSTKLVIKQEIEKQLLILQQDYNNRIKNFREKHKEYYLDHYYLQMELNAILREVNLLNEQMKKLK